VKKILLKLAACNGRFNLQQRGPFWQEAVLTGHHSSSGGGAPGGAAQPGSQ